MNKFVYSNEEFTEIKNRINKEILRRATYTWNDPLAKPKIGTNRSSPMSLPKSGNQVPVDDLTYTINNPSEGSIIRTQNIQKPANGVNPAGAECKFIDDVPNSSAAQFRMDEIRNFLIGLAKIRDINLFYGRDEINDIAYRDPSDIEKLLTEAEQDELNVIADAGISKADPNGETIDHLNPNYPTYTQTISFENVNGKAYMPSGETDGEELKTYEGLGTNNFFDDYGARPGDGNFHPFNRATTPQTRRDWYEYDKSRNHRKVIINQGGVSSSTYGANPRNPNPGKPYKSIPVYQGTPGSCHVQCTGLCYVTCDSQCSESCTSTCFSRCGNACTASCGNACTGCSTMCYSSCKTKCENIEGYACLKAGAKTVMISTSGGKNGIPAKNNISYETYSCQGCQFTCEFYPNKKTECWDAGCMGKCFTSCTTACSTSCLGGCIDNAAEKGRDYKSGKGRGCSAACTINCVGTCRGVCEGACINTCSVACKELCSDQCTWLCNTSCGAGCDNGCKNGCTGCAGTCEAYCMGESSSLGCTGCGMKGGCTSTCQHDCDRNCIGIGCRSICGTGAAGACEANCRINCMNSSCTALCENACSNTCSSCVNTCGWSCGACSSLCSTGCGAACEITCTATCEHSCDLNCVRSCTEACGGCSNLCMSCVSMCIAVCAFKCESSCTNCANNCGWWCDERCNQQCFGNCDISCMESCSGSCITFLTSNTTYTNGPERGPTSPGYPIPSNRKEEQESFRIIPKEDKYD